MITKKITFVMKKNPLPKMLFKWIASIKVLFLSLQIPSTKEIPFSNGLFTQNPYCVLNFVYIKSQVGEKFNKNKKHIQDTARTITENKTISRQKNTPKSNL